MKTFRRCSVCFLLAVLLLGMTGCGKSKKDSYGAAKNLYFYGQYSEARKAFKELDDYLDSKAMVVSCDYQLAMKQLSEGEYLGASTAFAALGEYGNAQGLSQAAARLAALEQYDQGDIQGAMEALQGTKLGVDLENRREDQQELRDVAGTWAFTLDCLPFFRKAAETQAQAQTFFGKDFCSGFTYNEMTAKVELKIDEDGLAVLTLADGDLDRMKQSFAGQFHESFLSFYNDVVAKEINEMGISREEYLTNYGAADNAGVFQADYKMSMGDFEKQICTDQPIAVLEDTYCGSGVAVAKSDGITVRFPERQWEVALPQDGKLTLTDGETTLSFTKQP